MIASAFGGVALAFGLVGGCSYLVYEELADASARRQHESDCYTYNNRRSDDERMYVIPQGTCPDAP